MINNSSGPADVSGPAKIYQFPPRGRFALTARADGFAVAPAVLPLNAKIVSGSAWYHDAAIQAEGQPQRGGKK